jgi:hypothetical protein
MLWLYRRRPQQPPTWSVDVRAAERLVAAWVRGRRKLAKGEEPFADLWSAHKVAFARAQHGKCAYCEAPIVTDDGTLDHHRPKGKITALSEDPATWGEEIDGHTRRDPRRPRQTSDVCATGYWWLAYAWTNYVFVCAICNEKWKGCLFPIEGGHAGAPTPKSRAVERPLLLDPYGDVDPGEHLDFDRDGLVSAFYDSPIGFETIRTLHLGRRSLQPWRTEVAHDAWARIDRVLRELARTPTKDARLRRALRDLLELGHRRRRHAGMVRILWRRRDPYGFSWAQLRALKKKLAP